MDGCEAARLFAGLELVEAQLVAARLLVSRCYGLELCLSPAGVRLGRYTASRVLGDAGGGGGLKRGAGSLARGLSGGLLGRGGQLGREGSLAGSMKKRKLERGGGSCDGDDGVLSPSASLPARLLERPVRGGRRCAQCIQRPSRALSCLTLRCAFVRR